jgi:hypothetical protein
MWQRLAHLVSLLSLFAYLANGAQAHMRVTPSETITIPVCGDGPSRTIAITIGGETEDTSGRTCCGDCLMPVINQTDAPALPVRTALTLPVAFIPAPYHVHPRSPLWPGAPPQGPPSLA